MRLNFSNADEENMKEGIRRLGRIIKERLNHHYGSRS